MKKLLSILTAMVLTLSLFVLPASAESFFTVEGETKSAKAGDTVEVSFNVTNNVGAALAIFTLSYDKDNLTITNDDIENGAIFDALNKGVNLVFRTSNGENTTKTGLLVKMKFTVNSNVAPGDYEIKLISRECSDRDGEIIDCQVVNGKINVYCDHDYTGASASYIDEEHHGIRCNKCGEVKADSVENHKGGHATCKEEAKCEVCGVKYGDRAAHNYIEKAEDKYLKSAATCTSKAVYYKSCSVCGLSAKDDDTVTEKTFEYGEKLSHNPSTEWDSDVSGHWKKCTLGCGIKVDGSGNETAPIPHTYDGEVVAERYLKSEADCKNDAVYWKSCSVCGFSAANDITIPESDRTFTDIGSKKPHEYVTYTPDDSAETYLKSSATCQQKATYFKRCKYCKEKGTEAFEYGDVINHDYQEYTPTADETPAVAATCTSKAKYYKKCTMCDEHSTDAADLFEFGNVDPSNHDYVMTDLGDGTHGEKCTRCNHVDLTTVKGHHGGNKTCKEKAKCEVCHAEYGDYAAHNYIEKAEDKYLKSAATCVSKAVYYKSCSVCGLSAKDDDTVDENEKTFVYGNLAPHSPSSDWSHNDEGHWKDCTNTVGCGVKLNGDGDVITNPIGHTGGIATCKEKAKCEVCGAEHGTLDSNNHVNVELVNVKAATEESEGYTGDKVCKDCGVTVENGTVTAKLVHDPKKVEAKAATAASEGNKEHWYCENCGKYYLDDTFETEVTREDVVIAKLKPAVVDKEKQNFIKGSAGSVGFNSSAAYEDFSGVKVDGKDVDPSNYDVVRNEDGTLRVVFKSAYLDTLGAGNHTVSIVSVSGSADTEFTVSAADKVVVPGEGTSPKTGDFNNIFFWAVMALAAVFGVFTAVYVRKKVVNR